MHFTVRQEQIVNTSIKLIANQGIQTMTIKNIAKEIGVSEPAIYRHFKSKFDIIYAVMDYFDHYSLEVCEIIENPELNAIASIDLFFKNRYRFFADHPELTKVMFSEEAFQYDAQLSQKIMHIMHQHREILLKIIEKGQKDGLIRTDIGFDHLFHIVIGSMRLMVDRWCFSNFSFNIYTKGMALWESVKKIL
ncbi:TetR/AcrR family transcriptional regulator [bacterium]|nr:TetR/AcrR family transcriptional regulator [bacterium]MBU1063878.1 TetR/AcrR family transcriptional regulator [bacterium]MBU1873768.1 TetR/AcrR family transcriptional regulator [bacterium]